MLTNLKVMDFFTGETPITATSNEADRLLLSNLTPYTEYQLDVTTFHYMHNETNSIITVKASGTPSKFCCLKSNSFPNI